MKASFIANTLCKSAVIAATLMLSAGIAHANPSTGKAMTWAGYKLPKELTAANVVRVGCFNNCDAYNGDHPLDDKLPILCIIPGSSPIPAAYQAYAVAERPNDWAFYMGWSGGEVGLTKAVAGTDLTSPDVANKLCMEQFGDTARIAEHHDNKSGGWSLGAKIHPASLSKGLLKGQSGGKKRFWVEINDQPNANPW